MSSLKAILETHPVKNLKAIIRSIKKDLAPMVTLGSGNARHSKATLINHIVKLDNLGLLKKRPGVYIAPTRKNKQMVADAIGVSLKRGRDKQVAAKARTARVKAIADEIDQNRQAVGDAIGKTVRRAKAKKKRTAAQIAAAAKLVAYNKARK